jgi:hypothetical protein
MNLNTDQIRAALRLISESQNPDQAIVKFLFDHGYIEATDVTSMDTPPGQRELLPTFITEKGRRVVGKHELDL